MSGVVHRLADLRCVALRVHGLPALANSMQVAPIASLAEILRQTSVQASDLPWLPDGHLLGAQKTSGQTIHTAVKSTELEAILGVELVIAPSSQ